MDDMSHNFGDSRYKNFTDHQDEAKKKSYLARFGATSDFTKNGIHSSSFWSRWLLWNKPTLKESIKDVEKRFNIQIVTKSQFP